MLLLLLLLLLLLQLLLQVGGRSPPASSSAVLLQVFIFPTRIQCLAVFRFRLCAYRKVFSLLLSFRRKSSLIKQIRHTLLLFPYLLACDVISIRIATYCPRMYIRYCYAYSSVFLFFFLISACNAISFLAPLGGSTSAAPDSYPSKAMSALSLVHAILVPAAISLAAAVPVPSNYPLPPLLFRCIPLLRALLRLFLLGCTYV